MEQNAKNAEKSGDKPMKCIDKTWHKYYNRITVLACMRYEYHYEYVAADASMEGGKTPLHFIRKLFRWISNIAVIAILICAILLVGVRIVGLTPYAVLSGSMEPTYHVGSLIYVQKIDPAEITVGMPITFVVNEDLLMATHRVVDIKEFTTYEEPVLDEAGNPVLDEDGNPVTEEKPLDETSYYFQTKGDANEAVDGTPVYYKNVVGTPVFTIPYLGYLAGWLQTKQGMIMGIAIALAILLATFIPDILGSDQKKGKKERRSAAKKAEGQKQGGETEHE